MILALVEVARNTSNVTENKSMTIPPTITIIGTGNVAEILGQRLFDEGIQVVSVVGRNKERASELAYKWSACIEDIADISGEFVLVCLPDSVTKNVIEQIDNQKIVAYTAGSLSLSEISHPNCGVFYPLQTFSKARKENTLSFPILIESKSSGVTVFLKELGNKISDQVEYCDSEKRKHIHLSAVFINNFSNHVIYLGQKLARQRDIDPQLFAALIEETIAKLQDLSAEEAQTGPAVRNDLATIKSHLDLLEGDDREIYKLMTNNILKLFGHDQL
ncbi:MAG: Rossmann-like and DUF2520 domain-containing protein [Bacteroidota bacterium]